ncbi:PAS domain S-box-containing protein [Syntrophus gentianae]|uniref:histidine kinase n=1 Tax=Syntrophus gentianae TaxID=43775 RepID=A0A1H7W9E7_9BACT|nr:ATP-binding protein [Syntrophus gentianae]SEM17964.1 PAS domain S-box-containing protein [Syntrophus gentianae]
MSETESKDKTIQALQRQIEDMSIRVKHLENDNFLTQEENESVFLKYVEMLNEWRKKNSELEILKTHLEQRVQERTVQLENSNRALSEEIRKYQIAEASRKESEERYRMLFENNHTVILLTNPETGRIVDANPAACEYYNCSREMMRQMKVTDIDTLTEVHEIYEKDQGNKFLSNHFYSQHRLADGQIRDVEVYIGPIHIDEQLHLCSVIHDITDRKRIDEELTRVHKLESVGILAGGIAHDFNNLLAVIMGTITLVKMISKKDDQIFNELSRAEAACIQARELTSRLITFSEGGGPLKKVHMLDRLLRESASIALSGSNLQCSFEFPDNLWPALIDEGQMQQVVLHLVRNAREAMPDGGIITISAENVRIAKDENPALKEGAYVKWSVEDRGRGIPEEHRSRIFDPYFTTKSLGDIKGRGLGLAICHSIIKKHEGLISYSTEIGKGTRFTVFIPASIEEKVLSQRDVGQESEGVQGRILVMDDEETVRQVMGQILTHLGYEVVTTENGEEAVVLYEGAKAAGQPFDLVILDLTVRGGMGGKIAIQKMREFDPDVRAIIATGYSNDPIVQSFRDYGFKEAITKPFTLMTLKAAVSGVLSHGS